MKQIEIYLLAQFFYSRIGASGTIVLTNKPAQLIGQFPRAVKLYVVCRPSSRESHQKVLSTRLPNASFITLKDLNEEFMRDKIVVCIDSFRRYGLSFVLRRKSLPRFLDQAAISIVSTPFRLAKGVSRVPGQSKSSKNRLFGRAKLFSGSIKKSRSISLYGRLVNIRAKKTPLLSVLAIMHVYNERDIIGTTIKHLLGQGLDVHIIDNWSGDGTYEIVKSLAAHQPRITYERFPSKNNNKFELEKMLTRVTDVAKTKKQYGWILLNDADEVRWSPWKGVTLQEAFSFVDSVGFNAVDYTVFNFEPTKEGFSEEDDLFTFFKYGRFGNLSGYFVQVKSWKNNESAILAPSGGHHVSFPGLKIFPLKFLIGHYPIRSTKHGLDKIFKERRPRFAEVERKKGWHVQYDNISRDTSFVGSPSGLIKFNYTDFYQNYLLERVSGIGIKRDSDSV